MVGTGGRKKRQKLFVGEMTAAQDDGSGHLDAVVDQQEDEVKRRLGVVGQLFGERDADRHFDVAGEPLQDFPHQTALAIGEQRALRAIEGGDGHIDIVAAGALRIGRKLHQPSHVVHV
ncbi:MAG: hypothetical protein HY243_00190 [Proteobacteria bacterium]|nr:hypothetical protein [Pseudomonadota bacterium]